MSASLAVTVGSARTSVHHAKQTNTWIELFPFNCNLSDGISIIFFLNLKLPRGILICHQWLLSNHSLQLVGTYYPSRSSLIFFKLSLPSLAVNGSQLSTGCPLYSIGNNGFLHRSPWKPWDSPQTSSLNWNKFPCCLWRIAKHFRHRRKVKGIFFNSPVSLPCSFSHVSY